MGMAENVEASLECLEDVVESSDVWVDIRKTLTGPSGVELGFIAAVALGGGSCRVRARV